MRTNPDTAIDPLGNLGPAIKPKAAPAPDPIRQFERQTDRQHISNADKAFDAMAESLRKQITVGDVDEWAGLDWQSVTNF